MQQNASPLGQLVKPVAGEGDSLPPSSVVGVPLVVQVLGMREQVSTQYGVKDGVKLNVAVLGEAGRMAAVHPAGGQVYRDVMWFNGALVDTFRMNIGQTLAVRLVEAQGKTNSYLTVEALDAAGQAAAAQWLSANPTALAPPLATPGQPAAAPVTSAAPTVPPATAAAAANVDTSALTPEQLAGLKALGLA